MAHAVGRRGGEESRYIPSSATAVLSLAVEEHGSDGIPEVVESGEVLGVEVLPPPRRVDRLPDRLPEQHEHEAVDTSCWPWALVADDLISWESWQELGAPVVP